MFTVKTIEHLRPLIHRECDHRDANLFDDSTGKYYRTYKQLSRTSKLKELGIDYPIRIVRTKNLYGLKARDICSTRKHKQYLPVTITNQGELVVADRSKVDSYYYQPKGSDLLTKDGLLIGIKEAVEEAFVKVQDLRDKYYITPKCTRNVVTWMWRGVNYRMLHRSHLTELPVINPPEYYDFLKDLQYIPKIIQFYYTKEELLLYNKLRQEGWALNTDGIRINGVYIPVIDDSIFKRMKLDENIEPVKCCDETLYDINFTWDDIKANLEELTAAAIKGMNNTIRTGIKFETLLVLKTSYIMDALSVMCRQHRIQMSEAQQLSLLRGLVELRE